MYKVIFLIGPPGSGKGTQAELLAKEFGLYHFEISKVIERKFKEADPADKEIAHQREHFVGGELIHPEIASKWFFEEVEALKNKVNG
ncbi:MAG: nucleoside monophosphate kinase, partial [Candidatus Paceibacteria bacterium]